MKINKQLNLVVPVVDGDETIYIHSAPIGHEVFEKYHRVIGKTFSVIYSEGLNVVAGPRIAAMILKEVAQEMPRANESGNWWSGVDGVENGLMNEIRRLCSVAIPEADGWKSLPVDVAIKRELISAETVREAEGKIVFFTLASVMHTGTQKTGMLEAMKELWEVELTFLNSTEYINSLPMLNVAANTQIAA